MDIQRELLAGAPLPAGSQATSDEPVPMVQFLAGACRAVVALLRFWGEVVREQAVDPITIEPRILHV